MKPTVFAYRNNVFSGPVPNNGKTKEIIEIETAVSAFSKKRAGISFVILMLRQIKLNN